MTDPRAPYAPPRLQVYGALRDLTLMSLSNDKNKNDSTQGQNNLKT
jgi:hypothetical protein